MQCRGNFPLAGRKSMLFLVALRTSSTSAAAAASEACSTVKGPLPFALSHKWQQSPDSWLLRYSLPPGRRWLGEDVTLPTCIKVDFPHGTDEKTGEPKTLAKSYSPVSHPATEGHFDLLVKGYSWRNGGGVGSYLCDMGVGDTMLGTLKSERIMHGDAAVLGRWKNIGLVAGGTGIAPLLQIARIVLESPDEFDRSTHVHLLSINRREQDILARNDIDELALKHPNRFHVAYSLTEQPPPTKWAGYTGRGSVSMVRETLPLPTSDGQTMVLVCGTDGFVETWGGPVGRAPTTDGSKGGKVQGPLLGLLAEAGFDASQVFKY
mmetsp:Transcript_24974/g.59334  ORF Transcript_24974/g.59334 Transcript_24974/m.59334 type:complete len:321 (-) Transcript_24974:323-1285(-)